MPDRDPHVNEPPQLAAVPPLHLTITPWQAFLIAMALYTAIDAGRLTADEQRAAAWYIAHVRAHFRDAPAVLEMMDLLG